MMRNLATDCIFYFWRKYRQKVATICRQPTVLSSGQKSTYFFFWHSICAVSQPTFFFCASKVTDWKWPKKKTCRIKNSVTKKKKPVLCRLKTLSAGDPCHIYIDYPSRKPSTAILLEKQAFSSNTPNLSLSDPVFPSL
jgi:hypothetical protein